MPQVEDFSTRIVQFFQAKGGRIIVEYRQGGYTLLAETTRAPIARLRPTGKSAGFNVLYWSHLGRWAKIGDFGGITLPLDDALAYVAREPIFRTWS